MVQTYDNQTEVGPHCAEGVADDNIFSCLTASKVAAMEGGHVFSWKKGAPF